MKRTLLTALAMVALCAGFLGAQTADEAYLKAMQLSDKCAQIQALDAYIANYAGKGGQYDNFAYTYYCLTPCATKNVQKAIDYGEKALTMSGLGNDMKTAILATIPQLYAVLGQMDKAKTAAQRLIDAGKASSDSATGAKLQAAGYQLIGEFAEKTGDFGAAAQAYITGYSILKDPGIARQLDKLAVTLYNSKKYAEAEQVFRQFYASAQDERSAMLLGQTLDKEGKIDEALAIYKEAYARKKSPRLASISRSS